MSASPNIFLILYIYQLIFISFANNSIMPTHSSFTHNRHYQFIYFLVGEFKFDYKFLLMILQVVEFHNLDLISRALMNQKDFSKGFLEIIQILSYFKDYIKKTLSNLKRLESFLF